MNNRFNPLGNEIVLDLDSIRDILINDKYTADELFYLRDLKQRKLFLSDGIDQSSVLSIVRNIMQFNADDKEIPAEERTPIILYLVSEGGEVDSGFELIDVIQSSKTPVYTVNLGYWYSMGFLIGIAGHKRFATKNSKILIHDGSTCVYNSGAKAQDQMRFQAKADERIKNYVLSRSKITSDDYDQQFRSEWYLFANEAKEKGFVDYIIGEDCEIDEVI
ncbi:MAG: ATP-dependent Clp protease proteolytic subunit [Clostridia bacterium]|nr:ATP-dependent Clp protease proteolytic subunit [Clostridia bacterium]